MRGAYGRSCPIVDSARLPFIQSISDAGAETAGFQRRPQRIVTLVQTPSNIWGITKFFKLGSLLTQRNQQLPPNTIIHDKNVIVYSNFHPIPNFFVMCYLFSQSAHASRSVNKRGEDRNDGSHYQDDRLRKCRVLIACNPSFLVNTVHFSIYLHVINLQLNICNISNCRE